MEFNFTGTRLCTPPPFPTSTPSTPSPTGWPARRSASVQPGRPRGSPPPSAVNRSIASPDLCYCCGKIPQGSPCDPQTSPWQQLKAVTSQNPLFRSKPASATGAICPGISAMLKIFYWFVSGRWTSARAVEILLQTHSARFNKNLHKCKACMLLPRGSEAQEQRVEMGVLKKKKNGSLRK